MTVFEQLQLATRKLDEIIQQPLKTQKGVEKLTSAVNLLNKVVLAILQTIPQDQLDRIKEIVGDTDKDTSQSQ